MQSWSTACKPDLAARFGVFLSPSAGWGLAAAVPSCSLCSVLVPPSLLVAGWWPAVPVQCQSGARHLRQRWHQQCKLWRCWCKKLSSVFVQNWADKSSPLCVTLI